MAALSADSRRDMANTPYLVWAFPVYQSTTIYKAGLVNLNASGYLVMATDSATDLACVGIAAEGVDNSSGSDGDKDCKVISGVLAKFDSGTIALTDGFADLYVSDSDTVDLTGGVTNHVRVGMLYKFVSTSSCWVFIPTAGEFATTVNTGDIAADAVTSAKIADDQIDSEHYVDGSIDTAHIAADQIDATLIADEAVQKEHIKDVTLDQTSGAESVLMCIELLCSAGAASYSCAISRDYRVIDFHTISTATNGGATSELQDHDGNSITPTAIAGTPVDTLSRATDLDYTHVDEVATQNLTVVQNAAADAVVAYIAVLPSA